MELYIIAMIAGIILIGCTLKVAQCAKVVVCAAMANSPFPVPDTPCPPPPAENDCENIDPAACANCPLVS